MYRFFLIVLSLLIFTTPGSQAQNSNSGIGGEINKDQAAQIASNQNGATKESRARYVLSRIDERVVREFERAWDRSSQGIRVQESLVLLFRMLDGSIRAVQGGHTNEAYQFTFEWNQAIIAIVSSYSSE